MLHTITITYGSTYYNQWRLEEDTIITQTLSKYLLTLVDLPKKIYLCNLWLNKKVLSHNQVPKSNSLDT